jgi:hypothetical protein
VSANRSAAPLDRRPARIGAVQKRQSCRERPRPPAEHGHHRQAEYAPILAVAKLCLMVAYPLRRLPAAVIGG